MPNPSRQEIIDAYQELDVLLGFSEDHAIYDVKARCAVIEKALPPRPQPTMAEVEWDDDEHYLAEAKHDIHGQVVMLGLDAGGLIEFIIPSLRDYRCDADRPDTLTPTGKRYTLTEVQE